MQSRQALALYSCNRQPYLLNADIEPNRAFLVIHS